MKTSTKMLILSVIMIVLFTIAAITLQFVTAMELSATLITCWYAFWTAEIFSLASIKNTKVKHKYKSSDDEDEEEEEIIDETEINE